MEAIRWPNGPVCPHCKNADAKKIWKLEANEAKKIRAGLNFFNRLISNLFGAQDVRVGNVTGATGMIYQAGGFAATTGGGNGLLLGAAGGAGP